MALGVSNECPHLCSGCSACFGYMAVPRFLGSSMSMGQAMPMEKGTVLGPWFRLSNL